MRRVATTIGVPVVAKATAACASFHGSRILGHSSSGGLSTFGSLTPSAFRKGGRTLGGVQIKVPQPQIKGHGWDLFLVSLGCQSSLPPDFRLRLGIDSPHNDLFAVGQEMDATEHVPHFDVHPPAGIGDASGSTATIAGDATAVVICGLIPNRFSRAAFTCCYRIRRRCVFPVRSIILDLGHCRQAPKV